MTDEFYACSVCGVFEAGTHIEHKVIGLDNWITAEELKELEEKLEAKIISVNSKVVCNGCGCVNSQVAVINVGDD